MGEQTQGKDVCDKSGDKALPKKSAEKRWYEEDEDDEDDEEDYEDGEDGEDKKEKGKRDN